MSAELKPALGPFDATMVVVGGIIGAGIFITPSVVAQRLDSVPRRPRQRAARRAPAVRA